MIDRRGVAMTFIGAVCNLLVMRANDGKMPVLTDEGVLEDDHTLRWSNPSQRHIAMTRSCRLKPLADIIPFGRSVYSIGDALMYAGTCLILYSAFKRKR